MNNISTQKNDNQPVCTCPHCNSATLTRFGFDRGTQRYHCKSCRKTFKATAGTPIHGLHKKEKIAIYLKAMRNGLSVRKAAKFAGISKNTSFAWRHKFLSSLEARSIVQTKTETSSAGIIQLKYSAKGRRKLPETNTSPTKTIILLSNGQLELHKLSSVRQTNHAAKIFSESSTRYWGTIPHRIVTAGIRHSDKAVKIKNLHTSQPLIAKVKLQITRLLHWMGRFRGVASKYLQNYWNWYASMINFGLLKQEAECFCRICTSSRSLNKFFVTKRL